MVLIQVCGQGKEDTTDVEEGNSALQVIADERLRMGWKEKVSGSGKKPLL